MPRTLFWRRAVVATCATVSAFTMTLAAQNSIRTIDKGAQSNVDDKLTAAARTEAEWAPLWKKHNYDKPAPPVDFSKEMVVAVFMGSRPTAGFTVEIVSASARDGKLMVTYREVLPGPGSISAQVLTAPYHIAAVAKSNLPVVFEKQP
jgi:hypothetical protein